MLKFKVSKDFKHITVSRQNYFALKKLGNAGDSFNDVVTELLNKRTSQSESRVGAPDQTAISVVTNDPGGRCNDE